MAKQFSARSRQRVGRGFTMALAAIGVSGFIGTALAQTTTAPAAPAYVVVQGETPASAEPRQQLTVLCPETHRALGVGYVALLPGAQGAAGEPTWRDAMLDSVRTMPDSAGTGFLVEGAVAEVERTRAPWKLVVRVVCAKMPL